MFHIQPDSEKCTGRYFKVRDVFKTGVIMYIQNYAYKNYSKVFLSIYYMYVFIFVIKLKHNMNIFFVNSIDR